MDSAPGRQYASQERFLLPSFSPMNHKGVLGMRKLLKVSSILLLLLVPGLNLISEQHITVHRPSGRFKEALLLPCHSDTFSTSGEGDIA